MDRKIATVVGATAALIAGSAAAQAAPSGAHAVPVASNYSELLEPIPNAAERLQIADAQDAAHRAQLEQVQLTLGIGPPPDYHHHHHHHHSNDWYLRNGYMYDGGRWVTRDYYDHHHHHHHHHSNDYYDRR